jgi:hypothetical protein
MHQVNRQNVQTSSRFMPPNTTHTLTSNTKYHLDAQIYIPDKGVRGPVKQVRYGMKPLHLQISGYFTHLHFACETKQQNFTQEPNPTRQFSI